MAFFSLISAVAQDINAPGGVWAWLLEKMRFVSDYALWIIVFTVLLKLLLSPLDFFQKYKMKKNQIIGEKIKPQMEALEFQYGHDKQQLQQAQMKLQRASGYSYFSTCLPAIITMVIFLWFFSGMSSISQYNEYKQYVERYDKYAERYYDLTGTPYIKGTAEEKLSNSEFDRIIKEWGEDESRTTEEKAAYSDYLVRASSAAASGENEYGSFRQSFLALQKERNFIKDVVSGFEGRIEQLKNETGFAEEKQTLVGEINIKFEQKKDGKPESININSFANFPQLLQYYAYLSEFDTIEQFNNTLLSMAHEQASQEVYEYYTGTGAYEGQEAQNSGFIWIKSIWIADVPWKNGVLKYDDFVSNVQKYMKQNGGELPTEVYQELKGEVTYNRVMGKILDDSTLIKYNGYLILAILAISLTLISQLITMRQQKKSGQAASAGMAGGSMKIMMFAMPLMIGGFALFSTSAFTLYMITNSAMGLVLNMIGMAVFSPMGKKERTEKVNSSGIQRYGRVDPNDKIKTEKSKEKTKNKDNEKDRSKKADYKAYAKEEQTQEADEEQKPVKHKKEKKVKEKKAKSSEDEEYEKLVKQMQSEKEEEDVPYFLRGVTPPDDDDNNKEER